MYKRQLYRYVRHHDFTMTALLLTMGREQPDTSAIEALCRELDVPSVIRHTEIYEILFEWRKDPLSLIHISDRRGPQRRAGAIR